MKFDNRRSCAILSERGIIQISTTAALTTSIATATFVMAFFTSALILTAATTAGQTVPSLEKTPNNKD